jgi:hypothetical protein
MPSLPRRRGQGGGVADLRILCPDKSFTTTVLHCHSNAMAKTDEGTRVILTRQA